MDELLIDISKELGYKPEDFKSLISSQKGAKGAYSQMKAKGLIEANYTEDEFLEFAKPLWSTKVDTTPPSATTTTVNPSQGAFDVISEALGKDVLTIQKELKENPSRLFEYRDKLIQEGQIGKDDFTNESWAEMFGFNYTESKSQKTQATKKPNTVGRFSQGEDGIYTDSKTGVKFEDYKQLDKEIEKLSSAKKRKESEAKVFPQGPANQFGISAAGVNTGTSFTEEEQKRLDNLITTREGAKKEGVRDTTNDVSTSGNIYVNFNTAQVLENPNIFEYRKRVSELEKDVKRLKGNTAENTSISEGKVQGPILEKDLKQKEKELANLKSQREAYILASSTMPVDDFVSTDEELAGRFMSSGQDSRAAYNQVIGVTSEQKAIQSDAIKILDKRLQASHTKQAMKDYYNSSDALNKKAKQNTLTQEDIDIHKNKFSAIIEDPNLQQLNEVYRQSNNTANKESRMLNDLQDMDPAAFDQVVRVQEANRNKDKSKNNNVFLDEIESTSDVLIRGGSRWLNSFLQTAASTTLPGQSTVLGRLATESKEEGDLRPASSRATAGIFDAVDFYQDGKRYKAVYEDGEVIDVKDENDYSVATKELLEVAAEETKSENAKRNTSLYSMANSTLDVIVDIGFDALTTRGIGKVLGGSKTAYTIGQSMSAYSRGYAGAYNELINTPGMSATGAHYGAAVMGVAAAGVTKLNPLESKLAEEGFDRFFSNHLRKNARRIAGGKVTSTDVVRDFIAWGGKFAISGAKESLEEITELGIQNYGLNPILNETYGTELTEGVKANELIETAIVSFGAGILGAGIPNTPKRLQNKALEIMAENTETFIDFAEGLTKSNPDMAANLSKYVATAKELRVIAPKVDDPKTRKEILTDLVKIKQLKEQSADITVASILDVKKEEIKKLEDGLLKKIDGYTKKGTDTISKLENVEVGSDPKLKAYDFDGTIVNTKTGGLTELGKRVKARIEAGEDIKIVTARDNSEIQQIQDTLGIPATSIIATGDESLKPQALRNLGLEPSEYYDSDKSKLDVIRGEAVAEIKQPSLEAPSVEVAEQPSGQVKQEVVVPEIKPFQIIKEVLQEDGSTTIEYVDSTNPKPYTKVKDTDLFVHKEGSKFVISDSASGAKISEGKTLKEAENKLGEIIDSNGGVDSFRQVLEGQRAKLTERMSNRQSGNSQNTAENKPILSEEEIKEINKINKLKEELTALQQSNVSNKESDIEVQKADIEKRKQALRDLMEATGDDIFMLGVEDGTFMGEDLLNMNENGDVVLTRYTDSEENLTKGKGKTENLKDIAGQFGGEQIATSGVEGGLASFASSVVGEYHIPLQELIDLIKSEYVVFAGLGNKEFVLSPHIADKYLAKINGKVVQSPADTQQEAQTEVEVKEEEVTTETEATPTEQEVVTEEVEQTDTEETAVSDESKKADIERRRQEELKLSSPTILWNNYGNESNSEWQIGEKTTTRKGEPAVILFRKGGKETGGKSIFEQVISISELTDFINAKYDAELKALEKSAKATEKEAKQTTDKPTVSEPKSRGEETVAKEEVKVSPADTKIAENKTSAQEIEVSQPTTTLDNFQPLNGKGQPISPKTQRVYEKTEDGTWVARAKLKDGKLGKPTAITQKGIITQLNNKLKTENEKGSKESSTETEGRSQSKEGQVDSTVAKEGQEVVETQSIEDSIPNLTKDQKQSLRTVLQNVSKNIAKRLGITEAKYKERVKTYKSNVELSKPVVEGFWARNFNQFSSLPQILFQPNNDHANKRTSHPKVKKLNLEESSENNWLIKYLVDGKLGSDLQNLGTKEEIDRALLEHFETLGEKIKSSDEFVVQDISDEFIDKQIKKLDPDNTGRSIDQEALEQWKNLKKDKSLVREKAEEQRSVLLDNYTYLKTNQYPLGLKVLLLENLLYTNPTYDENTEKFEKGKRDNTTLAVPILLNGLSVSELQKNAGKSSQNILNDYLWGEKNFKGEKIDLKEYQNNIHQKTENGIWFKFSGEEDLDRFKRMSALSATTKGRWCTGSDSMAKSYLVDRGADMYIFYNTKENNNVSVQVAVNRGEVFEIGGTLAGQDMTEQGDRDFNQFLKDNKSIKAGALQNYIDYKSAIQNLQKNNNDVNTLSYDDQVKIYKGEKYYKDKTDILEDTKKLLPIEFYEKYYNTSREFIHIGDLEGDIDSNIKVVTGNLTIYSDSTINADNLTTVGGDLTIYYDSTLNADNLTTVGGGLSINSDSTINADNLTTVGGDLTIYSDSTLNADNLTTVGGDLDTNSNVNLPSLATVGGDLDTNSNVNLPSLATVGNWVIIRSDSTLNADNLTTVGGDLTIHSDSTLTVKGESITSKEQLKGSNPRVLEQKGKAAIIKTNNKSFYIFGPKSDLTSAIHEKTHEYEDVLLDEEVDKLEQWSGHKKGTEEFSEAFAKGAERFIYEGYLADDKKLGGIFKKFADWFKGYIQDAIQYFGDINNLNEDVKDIYARMLLESDAQNESVQNTNPPQTTTPSQTVLEEIGKTEKQVVNQIYKFFTSKIPGLSEEKAREFAQINYNMWDAVASTLGGGKGLDYIRSKVAQIGFISSVEEVTNLTNNPKFQIVGEKGAKVLDAVKNSNRLLDNLEVAKNIVNNAIKFLQKTIKQQVTQLKNNNTKELRDSIKNNRESLKSLQSSVKDPRFSEDLIHSTSTKYRFFDDSKIAGGVRSIYGWGHYFTADEYKASTYGDIKKIIKSTDFNLINIEEDATLGLVYRLEYSDDSYIRKDINYRIASLENLLNNVRSNREFDAINNEIDSLKIQKNNLSEGHPNIIKAIKKEVEEGKYKKIDEIRKILINNNELVQEYKGYANINKAFSNLFLRAGYDGFKLNENYEVVIFNTPKLNTKFSKESSAFRGAAITIANGATIIASLGNPSPTTMAHEGIFHAMVEDTMTEQDKQAFIDEYNEQFEDNTTEYNTDVNEYAARTYEKYLSNGRKLTKEDVKDSKRRGVLQKAFDMFTELVKDFYNGIITYNNTKGVTKQIELSPQAKAFFDRVTGIGEGNKLDNIRTTGKEVIAAKDILKGENLGIIFDPKTAGSMEADKHKRLVGALVAYIKALGEYTVEVVREKLSAKEFQKEFGDNLQIDDDGIRFLIDKARDLEEPDLEGLNNKQVTRKRIIARLTGKEKQTNNLTDAEFHELVDLKFEDILEEIEIGGKDLTAAIQELLGKLSITDIPNNFEKKLGQGWQLGVLAKLTNHYDKARDQAKTNIAANFLSAIASNLGGMFRLLRTDVMGRYLPMIRSIHVGNMHAKSFDTEVSEGVTARDLALKVKDFVGLTIEDIISKLSPAKVSEFLKNGIAAIKRSEAYKKAMTPEIRAKLAGKTKFQVDKNQDYEMFLDIANQAFDQNGGNYAKAKKLFKEVMDGNSKIVSEIWATIISDPVFIERQRTNLQKEIDRRVEQRQAKKTTSIADPLAVFVNAILRANPKAKVKIGDPSMTKETIQRAIEDAATLYTDPNKRAEVVAELEDKLGAFIVGGLGKSNIRKKILSYKELVKEVMEGRAERDLLEQTIAGELISDYGVTKEDAVYIEKAIKDIIAKHIDSLTDLQKRRIFEQTLGINRPLIEKTITELKEELSKETNKDFRKELEKRLKVAERSLENIALNTQRQLKKKRNLERFFDILRSGELSKQDIMASFGERYNLVTLTTEDIAKLYSLLDTINTSTVPSKVSRATVELTKLIGKKTHNMATIDFLHSNMFSQALSGPNSGTTALLGSLGSFAVEVFKDASIGLVKTLSGYIQGRENSAQNLQVVTTALAWAFKTAIPIAKARVATLTAGGVLSPDQGLDDFKAQSDAVDVVFVVLKQKFDRKFTGNLPEDLKIAIVKVASAFQLATIIAGKMVTVSDQLVSPLINNYVGIRETAYAEMKANGELGNYANVVKAMNQKFRDRAAELEEEFGSMDPNEVPEKDLQDNVMLALHRERIHMLDSAISAAAQAAADFHAVTGSYRGLFAPIFQPIAKTINTLKRKSIENGKAIPARPELLRASDLGDLEYWEALGKNLAGSERLWSIFFGSATVIGTLVSFFPRMTANLTNLAKNFSIFIPIGPTLSYTKDGAEKYSPIGFNMSHSVVRDQEGNKSRVDYPASQVAAKYILAAMIYGINSSIPLLFKTVPCKEEEEGYDCYEPINKSWRFVGAGPKFSNDPAVSNTDRNCYQEWDPKGGRNKEGEWVTVIKYDLWPPIVAILAPIASMYDNYYFKTSPDKNKYRKPSQVFEVGEGRLDEKTAKLISNLFSLAVGVVEYGSKSITTTLQSGLFGEVPNGVKMLAEGIQEISSSQFKNDPRSSKQKITSAAIKNTADNVARVLPGSPVGLNQVIGAYNSYYKNQPEKYSKVQLGYNPWIDVFVNRIIDRNEVLGSIYDTDTKYSTVGLPKSFSTNFKASPDLLANAVKEELGLHPNDRAYQTENEKDLAAKLRSFNRFDSPIPRYPLGVSFLKGDERGGEGTVYSGTINPLEMEVLSQGINEVVGAYFTSPENIDKVRQLTAGQYNKVSGKVSDIVLEDIEAGFIINKLIAAAEKFNFTEDHKSHLFIQRTPEQIANNEPRVLKTDVFYKETDDPIDVINGELEPKKIITASKDKLKAWFVDNNISFRDGKLFHQKYEK